MQIEIRQSGPDVPDGVYPFILTGIKGDPHDPEQPRHVVPEQGPNRGENLYFWDWQLAIDAPGHPLDGTEFEYGTSTKTGPKSKMFGLLTALLNGQKPTVGTVLTRENLVGRQLLGTVQKDEAGYCNIVSFSAMPAAMQQQRFAAATGAPVAAPAAPVAVPQPVPVAAAPAIPQPVPVHEVPGTALPNMVTPNPTSAPASVPAAAPVQTDQLPF